VNNRRTREFRKLFDRLPAEVQQRAREAFQAFLADQSNPGLQLKKIDPPSSSSWPRPSYSVRVNLSYRAMFRIEGDTHVWFWIGHRSEYGKELGCG